MKNAAAKREKNARNENGVRHENVANMKKKREIKIKKLKIKL